jgi:hypothetical protein
MRQKLQRAGRSLYLLILEGLGPEPKAPHLAHEVNALVGELFIVLRALRGLGGSGSVDALATVVEALEEALQETVTHLESLGKLTMEQSPTPPGVHAPGYRIPTPRGQLPLPRPEGSPSGSPGWEPGEAMCREWTVEPTARAVQDDDETASGLRPFALSLSRDAHYQEAIQALGECMATLRGEPSRAEWLTALHQDLLWVRTVLHRHIASRGEVSSLGPGESRLCSVAGILANRLQRPLELLQGVIEGTAASEATP